MSKIKQGLSKQRQAAWEDANLADVARAPGKVVVGRKESSNQPLVHAICLGSETKETSLGGSDERRTPGGPTVVRDTTALRGLDVCVCEREREDICARKRS